MSGFAPKNPVNLAPPKDDPISIEHLAKCDGTHEGFPTYVAIKVRPFLRSCVMEHLEWLPGVEDGRLRRCDSWMEKR